MIGLKDFLLERKQLTQAQRLVRKAILRRNIAKVNLGRKIKSKRAADEKTKQKRAIVNARRAVAKKVSGGKGKAGLGAGGKAAIERRVASQKGQVVQTARRKKIEVRKREVDRLKKFRKSKKK